MFTAIKHILTHPCNERTRLAMLSRWVMWNFSRRVCRKPKLLTFCGCEFVAYPDSEIACLIRYTNGGLYDYDHMCFFLRFVQPAHTIIDIGANEGSYTLLFARCASAGRVIAVEPSPDTFVRLEENIRRNNLQSHTELVNKAIADKSGFLAFKINSLSSTSHIVTNPAPRAKTIQVPCTTLDQLSVDLGIRSCDFLKIDVEGFEERVILGARRLCEQLSPKAILFEANGRCFDYGDDLSEAFEMLIRLGYRCGFYKHNKNSIYLVSSKPKTVSPESDYFAFSPRFLEYVHDLCTIIDS
jgi:FkbM family methyltransferase